MRVILFGYYGYGNSGDEAVLAGLLQGLRRFGPEGAHYIVLSGNPAETTALHGVEAHPRGDWRKLLAEAGDADAWIFGGGSLLQDVTGPFTLPYYLGVLSLLVFCRQRVFFHGQGVGPIDRRLNRRFTAALLQRTARISLRDKASAELLASLGVAEKRLHIGADLAFLLDPLLPTQTLQNPPEAEPWVGLAVRPWPGEDHWLPRLTAGLQAFLQATGVKLLLVPMHEGPDRPLAIKIAGMLPGQAEVVAEGASYTDYLMLIERCKLMFSMRLHGGIFAALAGVPGVMLSYDPKVSAFSDMLGWDTLAVNELQSSDVRDRLLAAWKQRKQLQQHTEAVVPELRRLATEDLSGLVAELTDRQVVSSRSAAT